MRFVIYAVVAWLVLTVFATVYAISANSSQVRVLSKFAWIAIILLVPMVGAILYLFIGRPVSTGQSRFRSVAPDDDPEFLRELRKRLNDEPGEK